MFVKLTVSNRYPALAFGDEEPFEDTYPIWVALSRIVTVQAAPEGRTFIQVADGYAFVAAESPPEVLEKILAARGAR